MSDPEGFPTLQSIVLHEVQNDVALVRNSATEALLWLRRGLKFLKEFLSQVNAGQQDIQGALSKHDDMKTSPSNSGYTLTVLWVSLSRQRVWKDPPTVPRMGRARSVCGRCFPLSHQYSCPPTLCKWSFLSPRDHVFPAGTESSSILSKFQRRPGVKRGRRAEERLHQRDAPGPGGLPARHGAAAGHPGRPVRRVQPGVGRSGVKAPMVSLPAGADSGGQNSSWLLLPGAIEGILCTKECSCALWHSQVFFRGWTPYASLKKDFWSAFKSPPKMHQTEAGIITAMRTKAAVHCQIWFCGIFVTAVHVLCDYKEIFIQDCLLPLMKRS